MACVFVLTMPYITLLSLQETMAKRGTFNTGLLNGRRNTAKRLYGCVVSKKKSEKRPENYIKVLT